MAHGSTGPTIGRQRRRILRNGRGSGGDVDHLPRRVLVAGLAVAVAFAAVVAAVSAGSVLLAGVNAAFVPAAAIAAGRRRPAAVTSRSPPRLRRRPSRPARSLRQRAGPEEKKTQAATADTEDTYEPYAWQYTGETSEASTPSQVLPPADLPDLPDFSDEAMDAEPTSEGGPKVYSVPTIVKSVDLPDLPGDPGLLPPGPKPEFDGGMGFMEWSGFWLVLAVVIGIFSAGISYFVVQSNINPEVEATIYLYLKPALQFFQAAFLVRILLTQFPKVKTTEMPWAPVHYSTEWLLAPTRAIFKPEAGVDVAPIIWLVLVCFLAEFLAGPAGVFQLAREKMNAGVAPAGMMRR